MPKLTKMTWIRDFRDFAGDTSAHGVKNIFEGPTKLLKLIFLICWIICSVYATYVIMNSIITFINRPTGTKFTFLVENEQRKLGKPAVVPMPTISVCSHNKVKKSFLEAKGNEELKFIYETLDKYDVGEAEALARTGLNGSVADIKYEDLLAAGSISSDRLLMCMQRAQNCAKLSAFAKSPVFSRENSITGTCFRINPMGTLNALMGDYGALQLRFWADVQDYSEASKRSPYHGFTVAFHDRDSYGSTLSSGYLMSPGSYYKVDLRMRKESREPPPSGHCDDSQPFTTYGNYSEGACIMECKDRVLNETCGCVNVVPPINTLNYTSCTLKQWATCGLKTYLDWHERYTNPDSENELPSETMCRCHLPCTETNYEAKVSSSDVPMSYADKMFENKNVQNWMQSISDPELGINYNTSRDIKDNMMVLEVMFSSSQISQVKEFVKYTTNNLLGDIGGVLGLFLGASLFTILEFFQFIIMSIAKYCCMWTPGGRKKLDAAEMS